MADSTNDDEDTTISPPPTEEERRTETVNDEVKPKDEQESGPKVSEPDVSARLDAVEKELAALKAMMDTLGYDDAASNDDSGDDAESQESIEDLFD